MKKLLIFSFILPFGLCSCPSLGMGVTFSVGYKDVFVGVKVEPPAKKTEITVPLTEAPHPLQPTK